MINKLKNEGTSGDVYEKKGSALEPPGICMKTREAKFTDELRVAKQNGAGAFPGRGILLAPLAVPPTLPHIVHRHILAGG